MQKQYLVQKSSNGRIKYLKFTLKGKRISREWGLLKGESNSNYYDYKTINLGKVNELSPEQAAEADFYRIISIKEKEGYIPTKSLKSLPELSEPSDMIDFDKIPTNLCCSKPTATISKKAIDKLINNNKAKFFIKYNGGCHYIVINKNNKVSIYTRRWDNHTIKYPALVKEIKHKNFMPETMLIVELTIDPLLGLDHMECLAHISEIMKTNTIKGKCKKDQSKALKYQENYPVKAAVFGFIYNNGKPCWNKSYKKQWDTIQKYIKPLSKKQLLFQPQVANITSGKEAFKLAKKYKKKFEGFIVWDITQSLAITWNGKPLRRAAWKIKAKGEIDVIAYEGKVGKVAGEYGSLKIGRFNEKNKMIPMGFVSGLKPKKGETKPEYWNFPCVIEVTYDNIFPNTGLLQFGNFNKIHEDKTIKEVELFNKIGKLCTTLNKI